MLCDWEGTTGLPKSNCRLPPGLWLRSPAAWLARSGISSEPYSRFEYATSFLSPYFYNYNSSNLFNALRTVNNSEQRIIDTSIDQCAHKAYVPNANNVFAATKYSRSSVAYLSHSQILRKSRLCSTMQFGQTLCYASQSKLCQHRESTFMCMR